MEYALHVPLKLPLPHRISLPAILPEIALYPGWFGYYLNRPVFKRLQGRLGPFPGQARADHNRDRMLAHDFCRNVIPSIRGISTSNVITSGTCSLILSAAIKGFPLLQLPRSAV